MSRLVSVNVTAKVHTGPWTGSVGATGIDKRSVTGRVKLLDDHVEGDKVLDVSAHGGRHKAVYAYAHEDTGYWEQRIGRPLWPGAFGENLTTEGLDCTGAVIGETWRIGSAVLQVTEPRIPCRVFAGFWDRPDLIKEFIEAGRPGAYLAILDEGDVGAGDQIEVLSRPDHGLTIGTAFRARTGDRSALPSLLGVPDLPPAWQEWAQRQHAATADPE